VTVPQQKPVAAKPPAVAQKARAGAQAAPVLPPPRIPPAPKAVEFPPAPIREECDRLVARYPTRMAALLPVLHVAQRHYGGWVSPEVEAGVARYLGVGDGHVRGVLTFYAMFNVKPVGRHTVWVCRTLTCWLRGAAELTRVACEKAGVSRPGETGADGRVFFREMECLGLCEAAPAVWVDGEVKGPVTPDELGRMMDALK
jgi:NADH-quinone oxidoreductase subunit E